MPKYSRGSSHVNKRLQPSDAGRKAGLKLTVGPLSKRLSMETRMRVLGLALAGTFASLAPIVAHGGPPEGWRRAAPMGPPFRHRSNMGRERLRKLASRGPQWFWRGLAF